MSPASDLGRYLRGALVHDGVEVDGIGEAGERGAAVVRHDDVIGGGHAGVAVAQAINVQLVFAMLGQTAYTKIVVGRSGDVREVGGDAGGVPHHQPAIHH